MTKEYIEAVAKFKKEWEKQDDIILISKDTNVVITTNIDKKDFKKAMEKWYWLLDEYNSWDDKEFNDMLTKYNLTLDDLGVK